MWFIYWIVSVYIITYLIYYGFQKKLNKMEDNYKGLIKVCYDEYNTLLVEYNKVFDAYKKTSRNIHINDDIKSALRFAMIYSHPDKGNCKDADEFIKFKKLYDTYK